MIEDAEPHKFQDQINKISQKFKSPPKKQKIELRQSENTPIRQRYEFLTRYQTGRNTVREEEVKVPWDLEKKVNNGLAGLR